MSDFKRLCKRDRFYWLIMAVFLLWIVIHTVMNMGIVQYALEESHYVHEMWDTHPQYRDMVGDLSEGIRIEMFALSEGIWTMLDVLLVALVAQAVKVLVQETGNRTEVQHIFPIKTRNVLTYHYISGLLLIGLPALLQVVLERLCMLYAEKTTDIIFEHAGSIWSGVMQTVILFMLQYSLLLCCRRLTNHIPAAIFTFGVLELGMMAVVGAFLKLDIISAVVYFLDFNIANILEDHIRNWIVIVGIIVVLVLVSYIADRKKDEAKNGFYAFPMAHWMILGIVFAEGCYGFYGAYDHIPKAVSWLLAAAASLVVTGGVYFVTRSKKI
ncbi:MAG: hypothetical protein IJ833_04415 [Lachnospiraceae bacterium]|nr:hypothetical protein [Lachnospiraceae bacterium]